MAEPLDLRNAPSALVQTTAFYAVKDLAQGGRVVLLTADDPGLVLTSLDLQLRETLAWTTARSAEGWRTEIRLREDVAAAGVVDLLVRDHRRLDALLAVALRRVNAADLAAARPLVAGFAAGIRRHVAAENEVLAPVLPHPDGAGGPGPVAIMLHEHEELLAQLEEVERLFAAAETPAAWEVEPFVAILSGTLAKHEYREEGNLFPVWDAALAQLPADGRAALERRVRDALAG